MRQQFKKRGAMKKNEVRILAFYGLPLCDYGDISGSWILFDIVWMFSLGTEIDFEKQILNDKVKSRPGLKCVSGIDWIQIDIAYIWNWATQVLKAEKGHDTGVHEVWALAESRKASCLSLYAASYTFYQTCAGY